MKKEKIKEWSSTLRSAADELEKCSNAEKFDNFNRVQFNDVMLIPKSHPLYDTINHLCSTFDNYKSSIRDDVFNELREKLEKEGY